jgi:hypothetical protein
MLFLSLVLNINKLTNYLLTTLNLKAPWEPERNLGRYAA